MGITIIISLYATRLILSALGVKDFGIFNLVGGAIAMLSFLNASMASATQRFMSYALGLGDLEKVKEIFRVSIFLHVIIALLLVAVLEIAGYFFFSGVLNISEDRIYAAKVIYQFLVVNTLFTVVSVPWEAVINAHENMFLFAVLSIIEAITRLLIALYITNTSGDKLILFGGLISVFSIVLLLFRFIYCQIKYSECRIKIKGSYDRKVMKEMTGFASWSLLGSSTTMVANYGQVVVMNVFFGAAVNAAQGISSQVSGLLGAFAVTMLRALNPLIAKSEGAGDRDMMIRASILGSKVSFFLLMFMYVPFLVEMRYILKLWLETVPPFTVIFCQLLLVRILIEQLFFTLQASIAAVGNIRKFQIITSIISLFPLLFSYILFRLGYPAYTSYIVFLIYSMVISSVILYFSNRTFNLSVASFFREVILKCFATFLLVILISSIPVFVAGEGLARLISVVCFSSFSFLFFVWFIGLNQKDRVTFQKVMWSISPPFLKKNRF
jgi:Na+-driven multidrug efflux pump